MTGYGFIYKIWELACVGLIKSPLNTGRDQDDEDGGVAVDFLHSSLVDGFLKIRKRK